MGRRSCHSSQASGSHHTEPHVLQITFADFLVYDVLDQHRMFEATCLDAFPNLKDFMARFEVMPWSCFLLDALLPFPLSRLLP